MKYRNSEYDDHGSHVATFLPKGIFLFIMEVDRIDLFAGAVDLGFQRLGLLQCASS